MTIKKLLTSRQQSLLKSHNWRDFITVFNEIHNTNFLSTNVGNVSISINEKKKIHKCKCKK